MFNYYRSFVLLVLLSVTTTFLFAQEKKTFVERLSVSPSVGIQNTFTDFSNKTNLGYGLNLNYDVLPFLRLSTGAIGGKLSGVKDNINTLNAVNSNLDLGTGVLFKTNSFEFIFPRIDLNLTRLIFKDNSDFFNAFSVNVFASHGLVMHDTKIFDQQTESTHLLYGKHRGQAVKTREAVTSLGVDMAYKLNDRMDLFVNTSLRNVWNDRLDAWETPNSAQDKYSYSSVGLTIYFKNRGSKQKDIASTQEEPAIKKEVADSLKPRLIVNEEPAEEEEVTEEVQEEVKKVEEQVDTTIAEVEQVEEEQIDEPVLEKETEPEVSETIIDTTSTVEPQQPPSEIYSGKGNFIIVAAFQTLRRAKISVEEQKAKGQMATIVKNRTNTLYLISIGRYDDRQEAIDNMRKVRREGICKDAWVFYKEVKQ